MEVQQTEPQGFLSDDSVDQMLALAERLRASNGGQLDDSAILAVAEATGAPIEYVRLAVKIKAEKKSFLANLRSQYLTLEQSTRRLVVAGFAAAMCAFFVAAGKRVHSFNEWVGEFLLIISLAWLTLGLYNSCTCRESKHAAIVGAVFSGAFFTGYEIFGGILGLSADNAMSAILLIPMILLGAILGLVLHKWTDRYRPVLGLKDPVAERQELLRQLQTLQERLKSGEQEVAFLSVDIVGSTKLKQQADPLDAEYTFNEYHEFVARIARKHSGRVHSTAGDGVTCAFDNPVNAFAAARNISAGLIELNMFRNKLGMPINIRQGIHSGTIMTPETGDITTVNFAEVIDVAAHLQKAAPAGAIVVSEESCRLIPGGATAIGSEKVSASGFNGTIWQPKQRTGDASGAMPPPVPR